MKVESSVLPQEIEVLGTKKLVNFNVETLTRTNEDNTVSTYYRYSQLKMHIADSDEAILKAKTKQIALEAEEAKALALSRVIVTTTSGKQFYGDAESRVDIGDAIAIAQESGALTTMWKLPTGVTSVTLAELQDARLLSLQAKGAIIGV